MRRETVNIVECMKEERINELWLLIAELYVISHYYDDDDEEDHEQDRCLAFLRKLL